MASEAPLQTEIFHAHARPFSDPGVGAVSGSTLISSEVMALGGKGLRLHSLSSPGTAGWLSGGCCHYTPLIHHSACHRPSPKLVWPHTMTFCKRSRILHTGQNAPPLSASSTLVKCPSSELACRPGQRALLASHEAFSGRNDKGVGLRRGRS